MGLFVAVVSGASLLAASGSAVEAVGGGLVGGMLFGAVMAARERRGEHLSRLSPSDRVAVVRAVQQGEPVPDRLAPNVLAFAKAAISAAERDQRQRWVFVVLPALTIAVAVGETVAGSVHLAAYFWALTVSFLVLAWLLPGRAERKLKTAGEAARLAEAQITGPSGTSSG